MTHPHGQNWGISKLTFQQREREVKRQALAVKSVIEYADINFMYPLVPEK